MSIPLELHLGLVRLNAELNNLQRAIQEVLNCSGLTSGDAGPNDLAAKAQYLALEAAIRLQADRGPRIASSKQDDRSPKRRRRLVGERLHQQQLGLRVRRTQLTGKKE
jgi:hypothetical protein